MSDADGLTADWDRSCSHVRDEHGRTYVCRDCARARISALEARIAELERERDEARDKYDQAMAVLDAMSESHGNVAADRDEAVRLLRRLYELACHMGDRMNEMDVVEDEDLAVDGGTLQATGAYLALHPAQPETPTKGPR